MNLWSHVSRMFWDEAAPPAPPDRAARAATGAPAYLRGAVRFVVVGSSAIVLTAQVAGIRLAARVDADPSYCVVQSQQCKQACPNGRDHAPCIQRCNDQRQRCRREDNG